MSVFHKAIDMAFKMFSSRNTLPVTIESLTEIQNQLNAVTKHELNIDPTLLVDKLPADDEPPVTYMRILEHSVRKLPKCAMIYLLKIYNKSQYRLFESKVPNITHLIIK